MLCILKTSKGLEKLMGATKATTFSLMFKRKRESNIFSVIKIHASLIINSEERFTSMSVTWGDGNYLTFLSDALSMFWWGAFTAFAPESVALLLTNRSRPVCRFKCVLWTVHSNSHLTVHLTYYITKYAEQLK